MNKVITGLCGSGKSKQEIQRLNETFLQNQEVIIWAGFSVNDLFEKQTYINRKSQVVSKSVIETERIDDLEDNVEIIFIPTQYLRKYSPIEAISKRFNIKEIIIDELSFFDFYVPSLINEAYAAFGDTLSLEIKTKFSKEDYINQRNKANNGIESGSWAQFIIDQKINKTILTVEKLTCVCLAEIGYEVEWIGKADKKDCFVNVKESPVITREFINWLDFGNRWEEIGYDTYFANSSKNEYVVNHVLARGSNKFENTECLTIFRRFGNRAEHSMKKAFKDIMGNYCCEKLIKLYYTDCLNQVVSRTLGYRGAKKVDCLIHTNVLEMIIEDELPYTISKNDFYSEFKIKDYIKNYNKTSNKFDIDKILKEFELKQGGRVLCSEFKKRTGYVAKKSVEFMKELGYDVSTYNQQGKYYVRGLK